MIALSPLPVCWSTRCQPGAGTNESIENPLGSVSSTWVVVAPDFSVGTARLKSWSLPLSDTAGLISAWAQAAAGASSSTAATAAVSRGIRIMRPP